MGVLPHQKDAKGENSTHAGRQPRWEIEKDLGLPYLTSSIVRWGLSSGLGLSQMPLLCALAQYITSLYTLRSHVMSSYFLPQLHLLCFWDMFFSPAHAVMLLQIIFFATVRIGSASFARL